MLCSTRYIRDINIIHYGVALESGGRAVSLTRVDPLIGNMLGKQAGQ